MSTRTIDTNKLVVGYASQGWYNGRKATTVRQRCNLVTGSTYFALNYLLPPRARIVWAEMLVNSTVVISTVTGVGGSTNAPDSFALIMSPVTGTVSSPLTAPVTNTVAVSNLSGGTNGFLVLMAPDLTTAASSQVRGLPVLKGTAETNFHVNTATVGSLISLVVARNTVGIGNTVNTAPYFGTGTATSTSTAGQVDVTLYVEEYEQAPYAS